MKNFCFCSIVMGLTRAWLPSRKSDEAQRGAFVMRLSGHVRSGRLTEANALEVGEVSSRSESGEGERLTCI